MRAVSGDQPYLSRRKWVGLRLAEADPSLPRSNSFLLTQAAPFSPASALAHLDTGRPVRGVRVTGFTGRSRPAIGGGQQGVVDRAVVIGARLSGDAVGR